MRGDAGPARAYFPQPFEAEEDILLQGAEAHHIGVVLRLRPGAAVEVFDGRGRVGAGVLGHAGRGEVRVCITEVRTEEAPHPELTVATAVPKGRRWQQLVEKCTELGASRIRPVRFRHSVAEGGSGPEKWRRWAVEASKQCGRAWLPEIGEAVGFADLLAETEAGAALVCDPGGEPLLTFVAHLGSMDAVTVLIGPEAGLTAGEAEQCREHGFAPVRLGPHILRIETAAAAACGAVRALLM